MYKRQDIPPTIKEVSYVIKSLKNQKAPVSDEIRTELLNCGGEDSWERLHHLITLI